MAMVSLGMIGLNGTAMAANKARILTDSTRQTILLSCSVDEIDCVAKKTRASKRDAWERPRTGGQWWYRDEILLNCRPFSIIINCTCPSHRF